MLKDEHHKRRQEQRHAQDAAPHLPRQLPLARPRVHPLHDAEYVKGAKDVKDLEEQVPHRVLPEDVEVARAKHERVQALRDERDALGRAVAVDGKDEDAFRQGVGQVAQDAEDLWRLACVPSRRGSPRTFHAPMVAAGTGRWSRATGEALRDAP